VNSWSVFVRHMNMRAMQAFFSALELHLRQTKHLHAQMSLQQLLRLP